MKMIYINMQKTRCLSRLQVGRLIQALKIVLILFTTIYYDVQCPYVLQTVEAVKNYCEKNGILASFIKVDTLQKAKTLPSPFNNWEVFYKGKFETVNLLDVERIKRVLKK